MRESSEMGEMTEIRVSPDGLDIYSRGMRFVLSILWSKRNCRTVGCMTRVINPSGKIG